jgi:indolepyruvate ferredoxin oxidoreductase beta subunit
VSDAKPITLTIAALGGQGGGVVADWLIDVARRSGFLVQATSVPGVAQRTGATIYYLEFFPVADVPDGCRPIFALMPNPGDVDVVIASEIMEAGRAMQRGLVTDRTTLIASSHRIFAIQEKSHMSDGRVDAAQVRKLARQHAGRYIEFDMQALAEANGSVISAAMLGALCGCAALPFAIEHYRQAILAGGIEVVSSTRAFEAARNAAAGALPVPDASAQPPPRALSPAWEERIRSRVPAPAQAVAREGVRRLIDYQDGVYATLYLDRLEAVAALEPTQSQCSLTESVARGLALWMSFEDTIRVADLKIRSSRTRRVREEVGPSRDQLMQVTEFMKPRIEELCATMPVGLGAWVLRSKRPRRWLTRLTGSRRIETSSIGGFLQLYWLAGLRRWRRKTLRYAQEQRSIDRWLEVIRQTARQDYALATEIAECQQLLKGYGETHERGTANFNAILTDLHARPQLGQAAERVRMLRGAALADEQGLELSKALAAG